LKHLTWESQRQWQRTKFVQTKSQTIRDGKKRLWNVAIRLYLLYGARGFHGWWWWWWYRAGQ